MQDARDSMKQAIAGVAPPEFDEVTVMTVWPSNAAFGIGRMLGSLYSIQAGFYIFRLGHLIALASIPVAAVLFFLRVAPFFATRYRVTNRRVIVERGISGQEEKFVDLDRFDEIDVVVQPGQAWYSAGDLIFRNGETETFRLAGVSRPESFRQVCLKARNGFVGVQEALKLATI